MPEITITKVWRGISSSLLRVTVSLPRHNDLPWQIRKNFLNKFENLTLDTGVPALHTDIPRLRKGKMGTQVNIMSIFHLILIFRVKPFDPANLSSISIFSLQQQHIRHSCFIVRINRLIIRSKLKRESKLLQNSFNPRRNKPKKVTRRHKGGGGRSDPSPLLSTPFIRLTWYLAYTISFLCTFN